MRRFLMDTLAAIAEIILIGFAFLLGFYTNLLRESWHILRDSPSDWRGAVIGMWDSGFFIAIFILIGLVAIVVLINWFRNKVLLEAENERDEKLIQAISRVNNERDEKLIRALSDAMREQTEALLKAINDKGRWQ